MRRLVLALIALLAAPVAAQEVSQLPIIETVLDQSETIPGQSVSLRVNVIVPSWMPVPPEFPSYEMPNLRVRQPERASSPISRRIGGQSWAGVSRQYLLMPMIPGRFTLPPQPVRITYIGPDGQTRVQAELRTDPLELTGAVPPGAEGLSPFIAAESLVLEQDLSGPTTGLVPGASVIRTITARIEGTSPIVLPPLLPPFDLPAIRVYPASPQVAETDRAGQLSGSRVESETLMAMGGGQGQAPPVSLKWFNLRSGQVETAQVPGFDISVTGPPVRTAAPRHPLDWRAVLMGAGALLAAILALRWIWPQARGILRTHRQTRLAGAGHARRMLLLAISERNYPQAAHWLAEWRARLPGGTAVARPEVTAAFARIGATIYGRDDTGHDSRVWDDLARAVRAVPDHLPRHGDGLPVLNPGDLPDPSGGQFRP